MPASRGAEATEYGRCHSFPSANTPVVMYWPGSNGTGSSSYLTQKIGEVVGVVLATHECRVVLRRVRLDDAFVWREGHAGRSPSGPLVRPGWYPPARSGRRAATRIDGGRVRRRTCGRVAGHAPATLSLPRGGDLGRWSPLAAAPPAGHARWLSATGRSPAGSTGRTCHRGSGPRSRRAGCRRPASRTGWGRSSR